MTKLNNLLLAAIISIFCLTLQAQFSSQQAIDLVLNQVLSSELKIIDVFMSNETKSGQSVILLENNQTVTMPYSSNWVFFVNDSPFANWAHPCRYIFVDEVTGNYQTVSQSFFPPDWKSSYTAISKMDRPTLADMPVKPNLDKPEPNKKNM
jgi:hypothetical protein